MKDKVNNNLLLFSNYKEYFEILEPIEAKELILLSFDFANNHEIVDIDKS